MRKIFYKPLIINLIAFCGAANAADCSDVSKVVAKKLQDAYVIEATAIKMSQLLNSKDFLSRCSKQKSAEKIADFTCPDCTGFNSFCPGGPGRVICILQSPRF